jgi:hypothetical protein
MASADHQPNIEPPRCTAGKLAGTEQSLAAYSCRLRLASYPNS